MSLPQSANCTSCKRLGDCTETSIERVLSNYKCDRWETVDEGILLARVDSITRYGIAAVQALLVLEDDNEG